VGTVVLAGVDAPLVSSLRKNAALAQAHFEEIGDPERALARLGEGEVDAVLIGSGVPDAMVLAQRAHAKDRDVAVLLLAARGASAEIAAALRYAPYLGPEVSWCEQAEDESVERALSLAVQRTRQRRGYRAALVPWKRRFTQSLTRPLRPEAVLERLLVELPIGVLLLDAEGTVTSFNRRASELLSKSERELSGARLAELVPARVAPKLDALVAASTAASVSPALSLELGEGRVLELTVAQVVGHSAERGILVLLHDVSERARAAREKEQLRAELESAQRLASLGMLAAGVGHEINNPLTYVMGNLQYVLERLVAEGSPDRATSELAQLLRDALEGTNRIRSIVRDLRTFSRLESEEHAAVEIPEVVETALSIVSNELRHRARVVKRYQAVEPVRGDSARLGQVFLNLLTNAAQAIRDGHSESNEVRISIAPSAPGRLVVGIEDTGAGIPDDVIGKIFEPFFTTKAVGEGTGLGLSICQKIVAEHQGTIAVESRPGGGTTFRVTLPTVPREPAADQRAAAATAPSAARASVLVVDDEQAVLRLVALVLGDVHDVTVVRSGEAAVSRIQAGERFDVVLCDVMMPTMAGPEVYERVLALDRAQAERIAFMSGGVFSLEARAVIDRLPNERLDKPFRAEQLHELVRRVTAAAPVPADAAKSPRKTRPES
jgi:signal transduction histidine kinase/DNA-binding response OmpR family regulator